MVRIICRTPYIYFVIGIDTRRGFSIMADKTDKKMMTDDEWNAWTADVKTFVENKAEVLRLTALSENDEQLRGGEAFNADNFEDDFQDIINFLSRGSTRIAMRGIYKTDILSRGRKMALWPKRQGGGVSMPAYQQTVLNQADAIYSAAFTAYWNVLEENGASHLEMTRASNVKQEDGQPYSNVQAFVKARKTSKIAGLKADIKGNLWVNADNEKKFSISNALLRPADPSKAPVVEADDNEEESQ